MSSERSPQFRTAARLALRWAAFYTRGVAPDIASERMGEIASDLHEHAEWSATQGQNARALSASIRRRLFLGVPADLAWRRRQVRGRAAAAPGWKPTAPVALLLTMSFMTSLVGGYVILRIAQAAARGSLIVLPPDLALLTLLTLGAAVSGALIATDRARIVGALLLAIPTLMMPFLAGSALWYVSATAVVVHSGVTWWPVAAWSIGAAGSLVSIAFAASWSLETPRLTHLSHHRSR